MTSKRLNRILGAVLLLVLLGIAGGAYGANKLLTASAKTLTDQKALSRSLDEQQRQLNKDKRDIQKYSDLNDIAKTIVPQDKDQAEAVRQIVNIASASRIPRLSSITFPASTLGNATDSKKTAATGLTQLTPVKGISGVYILPITVQVDDTSAVPFSRLLTFLENLEHNRRTSQVSNITITPNPDNPGLVAFTLVIDEYIRP